MKKENMSLFIGLVVLSAIIFIVYYFLKTPAEPATTATNGDGSNTVTQTPATTGASNNYTNPDYANLTEEQVKIADIAIGKLLNTSEGITPPMISVKSFEAKDFSNTALGCPQPDKMYAEVITPGYQVVLEAQGKEYDYRLTGEEDIILCEQ